MACNCSKASAANRKYLYTSKTGQKTTFSTEIAARAAQIKNGGSWVVVPG